jgi:ABC-type glycerol-3-phosphate transport system permease component
MMVPTQIGIIGYMIEMRNFRLNNTLMPMIFVWLASGLGAYWMISFFKTSLPLELVESARIDGANELQIYSRIAMPCIKPGILTLALLQFLWSWNSYMYPLVFVNKTENYTIPIFVKSLASAFRTDYGAQLAGLTLATIPVLIIFSFGVSIQPLISLLSYLMSLFFPNPVEQSIAGIQQSGLVVSMLSVAILPAILEEVFSRGILLSGYHFLGKWKAAFVSALLFGLLHMNPQQFLYAFVVGFIFCFLVERTDSLYASILPHMVINGTTIVSIFTEGAGTGPVEMEQSVILVTLLLMALLSIPWLAVLLYIFLKINPPRTELELTDENGQVYTERFITPAMIGIFVLYIVCGIIPYLKS